MTLRDLVQTWNLLGQFRRQVSPFAETRAWEALSNAQRYVNAQIMLLAKTRAQIDYVLSNGRTSL